MPKTVVLRCTKVSVMLLGGVRPRNISHMSLRHTVLCAVYGGSSMDFADEDGFDHYDGAKKLWEEAVGWQKFMNG